MSDMTKYYFVNKQTGRRYEVIEILRAGDASVVRLKGEFNEFVEPLDKANFKRMGYTLIQEVNSAVQA
jgi:hypothetical protein